MKFKENLNFYSYCRRYNVGLWECPPFLFLLMGVVIILVILVTYQLGRSYTDPFFLSLIILGLAQFLLVIAYFVQRAFYLLVETKAREARRAEELVRLKDQFVFVAAHELRTPATAIKWGIDILRSQQPELFEKSKRLFDILEQSNDRLLKLVEDMLEVARIESNKIRLNRQMVVCADVWKMAEERLAPLLKKKNITLHNHIPVSLQVFTDQVRLQEIFTILLRNAILYNHDGGSIWVSGQEEGDYVKFCVKDNGIGIKDEDKEHIFEKFWRSDEAHAMAEGSGLGLFIAKHLVEAQGGKMTCASTAGKGAEFCFLLPARSGISNIKEK